MNCVRNMLNECILVRNNNSIAINLYNKLGFVTIKENSTYKVMQYEL